jgi:AraC family transcriptional regulator
MDIQAEARSPSMIARLVGFHIPSRTNSLIPGAASSQINMCLTPRPLNVRACYLRRWGTHRFERLGTIFVIPPGQELQIKGEGGDQATLICQLDAGVLNSLLGGAPDWDDRQLAAMLDVSNAQIRHLLFRLVEEVWAPSFAQPDMLEILGKELAIELCRYALDVKQGPATGGLASWRLRLIDQRLQECRTVPRLSELAEICNISVRQLTRAFRVSRGCPIGDYIERHRMEAAKRLLLAGGVTKAVADALGFGSGSSFASAFRRTEGVTPTEFCQRWSATPRTLEKR